MGQELEDKGFDYPTGNEEKLAQRQIWSAAADRVDWIRLAYGGRLGTQGTDPA